MDDEQRDALERETVQILWAHVSIKSDEAAKIEKIDGQRQRLVKTPQGLGQYLLHAMFLAPPNKTPSPQFGRIGDVWISNPRMWYRHKTNWKAVDTRGGRNPVHPLLSGRRLFLYPAQ